MKLNKGGGGQEKIKAEMSEEEEELKCGFCVNENNVPVELCANEECSNCFCINCFGTSGHVQAVQNTISM